MGGFPDFDIFNRRTGPFVIEDRYHQATGTPRQRVQVGSILILLGSLPIWRVAMHYMTAAVAGIGIFRVPIPKHEFFGLLVQSPGRINPGVDEYAMAVNVHRRQVIDPLKMGGRHFVIVGF